MSNESRSLFDWLLLQARIEPDHEHPLRVAVKHSDVRPGGPEPDEIFADADRAAAFVRGWLVEFVQRWEAGERYTPWYLRPDDEEEQDGPGCQG